ncbi:MAG: DUF2071 domain-containing protein [Akkermansiaceae bacterium]|nr:DUF2071 domain-containing protein [Akkermansiaceae bacterium]
MNIPTITGVIRRRILLNYRVRPEVAAAILPGNFRPKLVEGHAIAGICLIRLEQIRPKGLPAMMGVASENSAHRIAVEWEEGGETREGVYVPRRDTDSYLNAMAGGRIFPGVHHLSKFSVEDEKGRIRMQVEAKDIDTPLVDLELEEADSLPGDSIFNTLGESSRFFEAGCIGYSARPDSCTLDGLKLQVDDWQVSPLKILRANSAYYDDRKVFPSDAIELDHALLMRDIPHEWHSEPQMQSDLTKTPPTVH